MTSSKTSSFSETINRCLATERLNAYRSDRASEQVALARYLLNMALSEALYPILQFAEVALRNAMHQALTERCKTEEWYNAASTAKLTPWQRDTILKAKAALSKENKELSPGRIVAELNFGFWTGFFNKIHARTGIGHFLVKKVFQNAPKSERDAAKQDVYWIGIRRLRNRVFHHERIIHWKDLDAQHERILKLIDWIDPQLKALADILDRYRPLRRGGISYWLRHSNSLFTEKPSNLLSAANWTEVSEAMNFDGEETVFGPRWTSGTTSLSTAALSALAEGKIIACDIRQEYIHYLKVDIK